MIEIELPYPFNDLAGPTQPNPGDVLSYLTALLEYVAALSTTLHAMIRHADGEYDPDTLRSVTLLLQELSQSSLALWQHWQREGRV